MDDDALLRKDFCAEHAVESLPKKKPGSPHVCGSRLYVYKACSMQTDVRTGDSIILFTFLI